MNGKKTKQVYCCYGEGLSGMDGRSNHPQNSHKPNPNPEQGLNFLQFYEGSERWRSHRRRIWSEQMLVHRCKAWSHLDNIQVQGEAASYAEALAKIINESGYSKQQIFNVDEQPYVERRCHLGLSGWRDVNAWHQSFKGQADIMLGANEAGDLKLKPMLTYHSKNPRALKIYAKSILPVFCM